MIPAEILTAISDNHYDDFIRLLTNYGLWARYTGAPKVPSALDHSAPAVYTISDDAAMMVDQVAGKIKRSRPNLYRLFYLYYIKGLDFYEILSVIKHNRVKYQQRRKHKNYFEYNYAIDGAFKYLNAEAVIDLIKWAENLILSELKQVVEVAK